MPETRPSRASAAAIWAPLARFIPGEGRLGLWAGKRRSTAFIYIYEFIRFGVKQAWAGLFGGVMVAAVNRPQSYAGENTRDLS